jgi:hypothetical protein
MSLCPNFVHCDDGKQMMELLQEACDIGAEECSRGQWAYRTGTKLNMRRSAALLVDGVSLSLT